MAFKRANREIVQNIKKGYYYRKMPPALQKGYEIAAEGILSFQKKVKIADCSGKEEMERIIRAVLMEHPQFFYLNAKDIGVVNAGEAFSFSFHYLYDKKDAIQLLQQIDNRADYILSEIITDGMTDYDKCVAIHDYVTNHIRYNFSAAAVSYIYDAFTIEGPILKNQAVCEGIAKTIAYLLDKLSVNHLIVAGFSDIDGVHAPHAWNMVELEGSYYHIDATWDLQEINHFTNCSHMYVNLDDDSMLENHDWELGDYPSCDKRAENYYVKEGRFFRSMRSFELYAQKFLQEGQSFMDARFEDVLDLPDENGNYLAEIIQKSAVYAGKRCQVSFVFHPCNYVFQANVMYG